MSKTSRRDTRGQLTAPDRFLGCARLMPDGRIECIAVMLHEKSQLIRAALIEILQDHAQQAAHRRKAA